MYVVRKGNFHEVTNSVRHSSSKLAKNTRPASLRRCFCIMRTSNLGKKRRAMSSSASPTTFINHIRITIYFLRFFYKYKFPLWDINYFLKRFGNRCLLSCQVSVYNVLTQEVFRISHPDTCNLVTDLHVILGKFKPNLGSIICVPKQWVYWLLGLRRNVY